MTVPFGRHSLTDRGRESQLRQEEGIESGGRGVMVVAAERLVCWEKEGTPLGMVNIMDGDTVKRG